MPLTTSVGDLTTVAHQEPQVPGESAHEVLVMQMPQVQEAPMS
jgi:hypothetical protein